MTRDAWSTEKNTHPTPEKETSQGESDYLIDRLEVDALLDLHLAAIGVVQAFLVHTPRAVLLPIQEAALALLAEKTERMFVKDEARPFIISEAALRYIELRAEQLKATPRPRQDSMYSGPDPIDWDSYNQALAAGAAIAELARDLRQQAALPVPEEGGLDAGATPERR